MQKINPLVGNINFGIKKDKTQKQSFGSYPMQNYAPMPIYTQVPYGINKTNYIKLGIEKLPNGQELHLYQLTNGQKVEILKGESNSSIMTKVNVGGLDEEGFPKGIAHFIEHSMYHASKNYKDIEHECDLLSTLNNASTSDNNTKYYMNLATDSLEDLKKAIDIQADMLLNPEFSKIEKEKNIVKAEIQDDQNDEYSQISSKIKQHILNFNENSNVNIAGSCESIDKLSKEDMKNFHAKFYQPHNFNTVIITKHNPDDVIKVVANSFVSKSPKNFHPIEKRKYQPIFSPKRIDLISKESSVGCCEYNFILENANNPIEETKILALIKLLDSRYGISVDHLLLHDNLSEIFLSAGNLKASSIEEKHQYIAQVLQEIYLNPPSQKELDDIKKELNKNIDDMLNSGNISQMYAILATFDNNENYTSINKQLELINNLTQNDIVEALKYFDLQKANIIAIHPKDTNVKDLVEKNKNFKPIDNPVFISKNNQINNYPLISQTEQISGKKFQLATLNNNSKLIFINSNDDACKIEWNLDCKTNYSSNPATKWILSNMPNKNSAKTNVVFPFQDSIYFSTECELDEIESKINTIKRFSNLSFTQKDFEEAKRQALKNLEMEQEKYNDVFEEFSYGKKYTKNVEFLKSEIEKMTLSDLINDLNNMILNSKSTILVKAPISKNPTLTNEIANYFDSSNFKFQTANINKTQETKYDYDCLIRSDNARQNTIAKQYNFSTNGNIKDRYTFELLTEILNKKNFNLIREKEGLAYNSGASYSSKGNIANITLTTDTSCNNKDDAKKILNAYNFNISQIQNNNITQEEFLLAKNKLKGNISSLFEDESTMIYCLLNIFNNYGELENISQINQIIDSITLTDIQKASRYIFDNKPRYFINATSDTLKQNEEYFNTLGKIEKR